MKKKALSLLLSSAMVVSLAACGSSSDSASTATDSNATSSTEAANAEASTTASTGETSSYDLTELNIVVNGTLVRPFRLYRCSWTFIRRWRLS